MKTSYDLLNLHANATPGEIRAVFRHYLARYRPTIPVQELLTDPHFKAHVDAYLTLQGAHRAEYDAALATAGDKAVAPTASYNSLPKPERSLLLARFAVWRREWAESQHMLRTLLAADAAYAPAWALLGELYFTIDRLADGVKSYEQACDHDPQNQEYADRLRDAREALAGNAQLRVELSPEEELLLEARQQRRKTTLLVSALSLAVMLCAFAMPLRAIGFLAIPWRIVFLQAIGTLLLLGGLSFGRVVEPFERVMVWSTVMAGDRGRMRSYPNGLLLFVLCVASLWLGIVGFAAMSYMDEEWNLSTLLMLAVCAVLNLALVVCLLAMHLPWETALVFGGNVPALTAICGWMIGAYGKTVSDW